MEDRQLILLLLFLLLAENAMLLVAGVKRVWRWGYQYDELWALYQEARQTNRAGAALLKASANAIEAQSPDYHDRVYLNGLRVQMIRNFSDEDVKDICFELTIDEDSLPSERKGRIRELLETLERRNRVSELVVILARERPDVDWLKPGGV